MVVNTNYAKQVEWEGLGIDDYVESLSLDT